MDTQWRKQMISGLILTIVGSLLAFVGDFAFSWVDEDVIGFVLYGHDTFWGIVGLSFVGISLLLGIASLFTAHKKKIAVTGGFAALIAVVAFLFVPFEVRGALKAVTSEGLLLTSPGISMYYGFHLAFLGAAMALLGFVWTMVAQPILGPDDRHLRIALLWHGKVIEETTFTEKHDITVGEGVTNNFSIPAPQLGNKSVLFKVDRQGNYSVGMKRDFDGTVALGGIKLPIDKYVKEHTADSSQLNYVPVGADDWGLIKFKDLSLFFQSVQPDVVLARRDFIGVQSEALSSLIATAFVVISFFITANLLWTPSVSLAHQKTKKKLFKIDVMPSIDQIEDLLQPGEEDDDVGKKAGGEEGKFGDPDENPDKKSKIPKYDGKMVDKVDPKKIGLTDMLSKDNLGKNAAISSILSNDMSQFNSKMAVAMAGTGSELQVGFGAGGMGFRGTGSGGGGTGYGRIHGLGKVDTGGGMGVRAGLGHKRQRRMSRFKIGAGSSTGFCSKSNIRAVVRGRTGMYRFCYEKQLQIHPKLSGKIVIRWMIGLQGHVKSANVISSSMHSAAVEQCLLRTVRLMRFEKPKGGYCVVQWPFVFQPG